MQQQQPRPQQESILPDLPMYGEAELFPDWGDWLQRFHTIENEVAIIATTTTATVGTKKKVNPFENEVAIIAATTTATVGTKKKVKKANPFEKVKIQKKTLFSRSHKKKNPEDLLRRRKTTMSAAAVVVVAKPPSAPPPSQESSMGISFENMAADWYDKEKGIVMVFGDRRVFSIYCGEEAGSIKLSRHSIYSCKHFVMALPTEPF